MERKTEVKKDKRMAVWVEIKHPTVDTKTKGEKQND